MNLMYRLGTIRIPQATQTTQAPSCRLASMNLSKK
jgi:hypothetical protein